MLDRVLDELRDQRLTRGAAVRTIDRFEWIAGSTYQVEFPEGSALGERVLMPRGPAESRGLEDVRLARFVGIDGGVITTTAKSLCIHGDTPDAVEIARAVKAGLAAAGVEIRPVV